MNPESVMRYLETLSERYDLGRLSPAERAKNIEALREHPDIIPKFIEQAELNIERAAAKKKEKEAA